MTPRKAAARKPVRRPLLIMPGLACTRPGCPHEFLPTGDYTATRRAALAAGWAYAPGSAGGHGYLCPAHVTCVPWWPEPENRLAITAPLNASAPADAAAANPPEAASPAGAEAPTVLIAVRADDIGTGDCDCLALLHHKGPRLGGAIRGCPVHDPEHTKERREALANADAPLEPLPQRPPAPAADDQPVCGHEDGNWSCGAAPGHAGDHAAFRGGAPARTWPQIDEAR